MFMEDLTGRTFGRLTVLRFAGRDKHRHLIWTCQCECGNVRDVTKWNLLNGITVSCGCYTSDRARKQLTKHGFYNNQFYSVWRDMMRRCYDVKQSCYDRYGGRGISVCDEWHNVESFIQWCESQPFKTGLTIDRIDNNKGYSPENCRFVTLKENQNNRSSNHVISYAGKSQTITEWAEETGLTPSCLYGRINRLGWSVERALSTPSRRTRNVSELSQT